MSQARSDVPDEDTDLLVVPDEDSPFGSLAGTAKRRTDLDKASSNVLSESSSNSGGQFRTYNDGSTSINQLTGVQRTPQDEPKEEKVTNESPKPVEETSEKTEDQKPSEEKQIEEKPVEEKPVEEKSTEGKQAEGKPMEEKPAEEKPSEGGLPAGEEASTTFKPATSDNFDFESTLGTYGRQGPTANPNYAADASKLLSEILRNETKAVHVSGDQKHVDGSPPQDATQSKVQPYMQPSEQSSIQIPEGTTRQLEVLLPENPSAPSETPLPESPSAPSEVPQSNSSPIQSLFEEDNAPQPNGQTVNSEIQQHSIAIATPEVAESNPTQPSEYSQPSDTQHMPPINMQNPIDQSPSVAGTAASQGAIGNATKPTLDSNSGIEAPVEGLGTPQEVLGTPQEASGSPQEILGTNEEKQVPSPLPTQAPGELEDLFGKHIVQNAEENQEKGDSSNKNSTIMLIQTANETQFDTGIQNHLETARNFADGENQDSLKPAASYAPLSPYFGENSNSYFGNNVGVQYSEQPASVRHLTSTTSNQNNDEHLLQTVGQSDTLKESPYSSSSYFRDVTMSSKTLQVVDNSNQLSIGASSTEKEDNVTGSTFNDTVTSYSDTGIKGNATEGQQSNQTMESNKPSYVETEATTTQSPPTASYKAEYTYPESSYSPLPNNEGSISGEVMLQVNGGDQRDKYNGNKYSAFNETGTVQENNITFSTEYLSVSNNSYPDNVGQSKAEGGYSIVNNKTNEGNVATLVSELQEANTTAVPLLSNITTEIPSNATEFSLQNMRGQTFGKMNETSSYGGYFNTGLSNNSWQEYNDLSIGNGSENSILTNFVKSSTTLSKSNGSNSIYNDSLSHPQQLFPSNYPNYSPYSYPSYNRLQQNGTVGSMHANYSQSGAPAFLSNSGSSPYALNSSSNNLKSQFYDFDTITREQMEAIQNAAVSKQLSNFSQIAVGKLQSVAETKKLTGDNSNNNTSLSTANPYIGNTTAMPFNYSQSFRATTPPYYSSDAQNNTSSTPSMNNATTQFYDFERITLKQMNAIQNAAVSSSNYVGSNTSVNETLLSTVNPYIVNTTTMPVTSSQELTTNQSIYSMQYLNKTETLPNTNLPYFLSFNSNQSTVNTSSIYGQNTTTEARNISKNQSATPSYEPAYNYSHSASSSNFESNTTRPSTFENETLLFNHTPNLASSNYNQFLSNNYSLNQYTSIHSTRNESGIYPTIVVPQSNISSYNYSNEINEPIAKAPFNKNTSDTLTVPYAEYREQMNTTLSPYGGQVTWSIYNTDAADTGNNTRVNGSSNEPSSLAVVSSNPNGYTKAGAASTTEGLPLTPDNLSNTTKVEYNNKTNSPVVNDLLHLQILNGSNQKALESLVVGHFKQQDVKIAINQFSVPKTDETVKNPVFVPQSSNEQPGTDSSMRNDNSQQQLTSITAQAKPILTQSDAVPPSIPILSASSYSNMKLSVQKSVNYSTVSPVSPNANSGGNFSLESIAEPSTERNTSKEPGMINQDKLPFKNEEPIITSKLVNPADSGKNTALEKKPSLVAIVAGGKKKPKIQCKCIFYETLTIIPV